MSGSPVMTDNHDSSSALYSYGVLNRVGSGSRIKAFSLPEIASITFVAGSATLEPVALHCVELLSRSRYDYASISG